MWTFLAIVFVLLLVVVAFQAIMVAIYRSWLLKPTQSQQVYESPVAVLLSVRGFDPSLQSCLTGLSNQNYEHYKVFIIVDHQEDPAYERLSSIVNRLPNDQFQLVVAEKPSGTCSLKCDRLIQLINQIPDRFEAFCFIDADAVPEREWIGNLTAAFADDKVGATTGNRWFHPSGYRWGSMIRSLWNSAAVVQMYVYGIAWGGSMAVRRSAFEQANLAQKWKTAMYEDVMIGKQIRDAGFKLISVPEVLVVNHEQASLRAAHNWIHRQLHDARLYHRKWPLVLLHAISTTLIWLSCLTGILITVFTGPSVLIYGFFLLTCGNYIANFVLLFALESTAQDAIETARKRINEQPAKRWFNPRRFVQAFIAIPILQWFHIRAALGATFARSTRWRGCRYSIKRPFDVTLQSYEVYQTESNQEELTSIH